LRYTSKKFNFCHYAKKSYLPEAFHIIAADVIALWMFDPAENENEQISKGNVGNVRTAYVCRSKDMFWYPLLEV
jgi:hypothetical protein